MKFEPKKEGFKWPSEMEIENTSGHQLHIKPLLIIHSGLDRVLNDRQLECLRMYDTPIGCKTELELNYWSIGGEKVVSAFLGSFSALFANVKTLPVSYVKVALVEGGLPNAVVEINIDWLISGNYVVFDPVRMLIGVK